MQIMLQAIRDGADGLEGGEAEDVGSGVESSGPTGANRGKQ